MSEDAVRLEHAFSCYLAEYNSLRQEVLSRIQTQVQCFNFVLIITGGAITAVVSTVNSAKPDLYPVVFLAVGLMLPLFTCPLAYMFFDNEIMIHGIGSYLYYHSNRQMKLLTNDPSVFGNILAFPFLPPSTGKVFPPISAGRWLLFALPAFFPLFLVPVFVIMNWYTILSFRIPPLVLGAMIYGLDVLLCVRLYSAMRWIGDNRKHQERLSTKLHQDEVGEWGAGESAAVAGDDHHPVVEAHQIRANQGPIDR